jgi:hypothetical protein
MKTTKTEIRTKAKSKAVSTIVCSFYWKSGARCVLAPQVREFDRCGSVPCTIESVKSVTITRPD